MKSDWNFRKVGAGGSAGTGNNFLKFWSKGRCAVKPRSVPELER